MRNQEQSNRRQLEQFERRQQEQKAKVAQRAIEEEIQDLSTNYEVPESKKLAFQSLLNTAKSTKANIQQKNKAIQNARIMANDFPLKDNIFEELLEVQSLK